MTSARRCWLRKSRVPLASILSVVLIAALLVVSPNRVDAQALSDRYQSNVVRVAMAGETVGAVHNVDVDVRVQVGGCNDPDTCQRGVRARDGYTWFIALAVELGDTAQPREVEYQMHGGLAKGGTGRQNSWYADWSGYYGPDHPRSGVLPGGSQRNVSYKAGDWVRFRVWRVNSPNCSRGQWGWLFSVTNNRTGIETPIGTHCLAADTITGAYSFSEVIEDDPCTTDLRWVMSKNFRFRDRRNRVIAPSSAVSLYSDDTCENTMLFRGHTADPTNRERRLIVDRRNLRQPRREDSGAQLWGRPT